MVSLNLVGSKKENTLIPNTTKQKIPKHPKIMINRVIKTPGNPPNTMYPRRSIDVDVSIAKILIY